jgi:hypothetical protein
MGRRSRRRTHAQSRRRSWVASNATRLDKHLGTPRAPTAARGGQGRATIRFRSLPRSAPGAAPRCNTAAATAGWHTERDLRLSHTSPPSAGGRPADSHQTPVFRQATLLVCRRPVVPVRSPTAPIQATDVPLTVSLGFARRAPPASRDPLAPAMAEAGGRHPTRSHAGTRAGPSAPRSEPGRPRPRRTARRARRRRPRRPQSALENPAAGALHDPDDVNTSTGRGELTAGW